MTTESVRHRASRIPHLGAGAIADYRAAGWHITASGHLDAGMVTGPCARCRRRDHIRYGTHGRPLCPACRPIEEEQCQT